MRLPPPPEGFVLDAPQVPPPPDGFVLDAAPSQAPQAPVTPVTPTQVATPAAQPAMTRKTPAQVLNVASPQPAQPAKMSRSVWSSLPSQRSQPSGDVYRDAKNPDYQPDPQAVKSIADLFGKDRPSDQDVEQMANMYALKAAKGNPNSPDYDAFVVLSREQQRRKGVESPERTRFHASEAARLGPRYIQEQMELRGMSGDALKGIDEDLFQKEYLAARLIQAGKDVRYGANQNTRDGLKVPSPEAQAQRIAESTKLWWQMPEELRLDLAKLAEEDYANVAAGRMSQKEAEGAQRVVEGFRKHFGNVGGDVLAGFGLAGMDLLSTAARGGAAETGGIIGGNGQGNTATADELNSMSGAIERAFSASDEQEGRAGWFGRATRGVSRSLGVAVPAGLLGGPAGAISAGATTSYNQAMTDGKKAGLKGASLAEYAIEAGLIEGGITAIFQKMGLGGMESAFSKSALRETSKGFTNALKQLGKSSVAELAEEENIALAQAGNAVRMAVNSGAMDDAQLAQTISDTAIQTLLTVGAVNAPNVARGAAQSAQTKRDQFNQRKLDKAIEKLIEKLPLAPEQTDKVARTLTVPFAAKTALAPGGATTDVQGPGGYMAGEVQAERATTEAGQRMPVAQPEAQTPAQPATPVAQTPPMGEVAVPELAKAADGANADGTIAGMGEEWRTKTSVTDDAGEPLLVYHGTRATFDTFDDKFIGTANRSDTSALGFWFTPDKRLAKTFAAVGDGGKPTVRQHYLDVRNPAKLRVEDLYKWNSKSSEVVPAVNFKALRKRLIDEGYDGAIIEPASLDVDEKLGLQGEFDSPQYVAFFSKQVGSQEGVFEAAQPSPSVTPPQVPAAKVEDVPVREEAKPTRKALVARARSLGIPAKGTNAVLQERIAKAEQVAKPAAQPSPVPEQQTEAKQPWEMGKAEYVAANTKPNAGWQVTGSFEGNHAYYTEQAVKEGKPVPASVLRDYTGQPWADAALAKMEGVARQTAAEAPPQGPVVAKKTPGDIDVAGEVRAAQQRAETPADMVATSFTQAPMWASGDGNQNAAKREYQKLLKAVPEFAIDPTFTVDAEGRLIYKDGYTLKYEPQTLGFASDYLKPGQRVRVDLAALGIKTDAAIRAADKMLKTNQPVSQKPTATKSEAQPPLNAWPDSPRAAADRAELQKLTRDELEQVAKAERVSLEYDAPAGSYYRSKRSVRTARESADIISDIVAARADARINAQAMSNAKAEAAQPKSESAYAPAIREAMAVDIAAQERRADSVTDESGNLAPTPKKKSLLQQMHSDEVGSLSVGGFQEVAAATAVGTSQTVGKLREASANLGRAWRAVVDLPANVLKAIPEDNPVGKLRDFMGKMFVPHYGAPVTWAARMRRARGESRDALFVADEIGAAMTKKLTEAGFDPENPDTHITLERFIRGEGDIKTLPPVARAWVKQARAAVTSESLRAADIYEAAGLTEKANLYRENADKYLKNIPLTEVSPSKKFRQFVSKLIGPRLSTSWGKYKRDAWIVKDGKRIRKFQTQGEALAYKNELVLAKKQAMITKRAQAKGEKMADLLADMRVTMTELPGEPGKWGVTAVGRRLVFTDKAMADKVAKVLETAAGSVKLRKLTSDGDPTWAVEANGVTMHFTDAIEARDAYAASLAHEAQNLPAKYKRLLGIGPNDLYRSAVKGVTVLPPLSAEWRLANEVHDPRYLVAKSIVETRHDAEMVRLFTLAADKWGVKLPEGTQDAEAWAKENGLEQLPETGRLHNLAGMYVPKAIAADLVEYTRLPGMAEKVYRAYLTAWKSSKTIYNPATHARNVIGNTVFSFIAGNSLHNPLNAVHYRDAIVELRQRGEDYHELVKAGVIGSEFYGAEIRRIEQKFKGASDGKLDDAIASLKGIHNFFGKLYAVEDQVFKMAAYKKYRAEGMTKARAAAEVNKWFPNYEEVAKISKWLRVSPIGAPFISFMDQSIRIAGRAAREHPIRLAAIMALPGIISMIGAYGAGMTPEEKVLLDQNRGYFEPILPWRDGFGRVQTMDLRYTIPLANDIIPEMRNGNFSLPWALSSPLIKGAAEQMFNEDQFSGKPIVKDGMTGGEQAGARAWQAFKTMAPVPTGPMWGYERIKGASNGDRKETVANAVLGAVGGINLRPPFVAEKFVKDTAVEMLLTGDAEQAKSLIDTYNRLYKSPKMKAIAIDGLVDSAKTSATRKRSSAIEDAAALLLGRDAAGASKLVSEFNANRPKYPSLIFGGDSGEILVGSKSNPISAITMEQVQQKADSLRAQGRER